MDRQHRHTHASITLGLLLMAPCGAFLQAAAPRTPREAIELAVSQRMGDVSVLVGDLRTNVVGEPNLEARPDPGGRAGRPVRFVFSVDGKRRGFAVATIQVEARYARAARAIGRDETLTDEAVEIVTGELPRVAFRHLPGPDDVVGLTARRAIAAGEPLTEAVVRVPPAVASGEKVSVTVTAGRVTVTTIATASGTGHVGDVIRVIVPGRQRRLPVRILEPGMVEVLQ